MFKSGMVNKKHSERLLVATRGQQVQVIGECVTWPGSSLRSGDLVGMHGARPHILRVNGDFFRGLMPDGVIKFPCLKRSPTLLLTR